MKSGFFVEQGKMKIGIESRKGESLVEVIEMRLIEKWKYVFVLME